MSTNTRRPTATLETTVVTHTKSQSLGTTPSPTAPFVMQDSDVLNMVGINKEQSDYPVVYLLKSTKTPSSAEHQQGRNNKTAKKPKRAAVSRKNAKKKADDVIKNKVRDREGLYFFDPISAH